MEPNFCEKGTVIKVNGSDNLNASPVNNAPTANKQSVGETSPPSKQSDPEPQKNEKKTHRLSRFFKKILKIRFIQTGPPVNITYVNITVDHIDSHNLPNTNMTINGPISIYNSTINQEIHEEKVSVEKHDEKQSEDDDESDEDHHGEYVEFESIEASSVQKSNDQSGFNDDYSESILAKYISNKEISKELIQWLQAQLREDKPPKAKLKPLRAAYEAGLLTDRPKLEEYRSEFGYISRSRYYEWMGVEIKYKSSEIDPLIEQLRAKFV